MAEAPDGPGIPPLWSSSPKSGVGTALSALSRVWFTVSSGILGDCYYPRVDQACIRDFGFIVTDGERFFAEEKRDTASVLSAVADGVPAYALVNTHRPADGGPPRFRIHKRIFSDPLREVVLQEVRLETLPAHDGPPLRLHALLAPYLVNTEAGNTGWLGSYKGEDMLFAEGQGTAIALAASRPWRARSAGYAGTSDGWQDLSRHHRMTWQYERAVDGAVALTGELALNESATVVLALGFGAAPAEAAFRARASLQDDFGLLLEGFASGWLAWQRTLRPLDRFNSQGHNTYRVSTALLRSHEAPSFRGGSIASLCIPWGMTRGDDDLGGYHLVWPRALVESAGALLAVGAHRAAVRVLDYLRTTQEADGRWPQNNWLDGTSYSQGIQLDECAFPILLVELAVREAAIGAAAVARYWPMVRAAAGFIVRSGPITGQDRWEESSGFATFSLAAAIAALLAAADLADAMEPGPIAAVLRQTADAWNAGLDDWVYVRGSRLAREAGVDGHYVRMAPDNAPATGSAPQAEVVLSHRAEGQNSIAADEVVSTDVLALVRFGLRAADDPRIVSSIAVIDRTLREALPAGPCWRRYSGDGYGEHEDGSPFDGTGIGRPWPLLTGERAHLCIAAGRLDEAAALLATLERLTSDGALFPEQVWDGPDLPAFGLRHGCPTGSAMPLAWAHAEHLKLLRSLADGRVFDRPAAAHRRYVERQTPQEVQPWQPGFRPETLPAGSVLRIDLPADSIVHWSDDDWASVHETPTGPTGLGFVCVALPTAPLAAGETIVFTWQDATSGAWAGEDFRITVADAPPWG